MRKNNWRNFKNNEDLHLTDTQFFSTPVEKSLRATINSMLLHYTDKVSHFNQNIFNLRLHFLFIMAVEENWESAVLNKSLWSERFSLIFVTVQL